MKGVIIFLLFFGIAGLMDSADAAMLSGKVDSYDPATRKLTLSSTDPVTGKSVKADVWLDSNVKAEGLAVPGGITPGEHVWVDAEADFEGNLRAASISKA